MRTAGLLDSAEALWAATFWDAWSAGAWQTLAADERQYGQRHLARHLAATDRSSARLGQLVDLAWRDAWRAVDPSDEGFVQDVDVAWDLAGDDLALQIRCCLCRSSAASVQAEMPAGLLALAVRHRLMTLGEALARARRTPEESWRAVQLEELARLAPDPMLRDLLPAASELDGEYPRSRTLAALAARGAPAERRHVLHAARRIATPRDRARVLAALLPGEPAAGRAALAAELLATADQIALGFEWREVLAPAIPHLPVDLLPEVARGAARVAERGRRGRSSNTAEAAEVIVLAAARAPATCWPPLLEALASLDGPFHVANALAALAPRLPPEHRAVALALARTLSDPEARLRALAALGETADTEDPRAALVAARQRRDQGLRATATARWLGAAAGAEREALFAEAVAAASRASMPLATLVAVALRVPSDLRPRALGIALAAIDGETNPTTRIAAALALAGGLAPSETTILEAVKERLLALVRAPEELDLTPAELVGIAALLDPDERRTLLERAHRVTRAINNADGQIHVFRELLPATPAELIGVAVETARAILGERERAEALVLLAERVPPDEAPAIVREALDQFASLLDEAHEAEALVALAAFVDPAERNPILLHALRRLAAAGPRERFAHATSDRHAPGSLQGIIADALGLVVEARGGAPEGATAARIRAAALAAARAISAAAWRVNALIAVARHANGDEWPEVWRAAGDLDLTERLRILLARAEVEDPERRRATVRAAMALAAEGYARDDQRLAADLHLHLSELARLSADETADELLALVAGIPSSWWRTQGLRQINPHLSSARREEAIEIARAIPPDSMGLLAETLAELAHPPPPAEPCRPLSSGVRSPGEPPTDEEWRRALALGERFAVAGSSIKKTTRLVELAARSVPCAQAVRRERAAAVLHQLALERRPLVLRELAALAPLLASLHPDTATTHAVCAAVRTVCSWPL